MSLYFKTQYTSNFPKPKAPQKKDYTRIKWVIIFTISSIDGRWEGSLDQQRVIRLSMGLGKFLISGGRVPVIKIKRREEKECIYPKNYVSSLQVFLKQYLFYRTCTLRLFLSNRSMFFVLYVNITFS